MTMQEKIKLIEENINGKAVEIYFLADFGEKLGIYKDGHIAVGQDVGNEICDDETPISYTTCPGFNNLDLTDFFTTGWTKYMGFNEDRGEDTWRVKKDGKILTLKECVIDCCKNGDILDEIENLKNQLIENIEEQS
jgi:hypothetical protein